MDISGIAAGSIVMNTARLMNDINLAMMSKVMDVAQVQEQGLEKMIEAADPERLLDTYA